MREHLLWTDREPRTARKHTHTRSHMLCLRFAVMSRQVRLEQNRKTNRRPVCFPASKSCLQVLKPMSVSPSRACKRVVRLTLPLPLLAVSATVLRSVFSLAASRNVTSALAWSNVRHLGTRLPAGCSHHTQTHTHVRYFSVP